MHWCVCTRPENEQSFIHLYVCWGIEFAPVYTIFRLDLDFGTVLTMWHWKLKIDNTNPTKTGCELGCSGKCRSSCSTSEARHHWQCSSANNLEQFWSILIGVSDFVLLYTDRHGKKILRETHCHLFSEREFGDEYYYGIKYNICNIYRHCMFWTEQLTNWPSITIILNIPDLQMNEYFYMKYKPNVIKYNYTCINFCRLKLFICIT